MRSDSGQSGTKLLTVAEAALEARVSKDTIWRHIEKGALKVKRVGPHRRIRIRQQDLDAYIGVESAPPVVEPPQVSPATDFVYFIASADLVKIGVTGLIRHRLKTLRAAAAVTTRLVAIIPCQTPDAAYDLERKLHNRLSPLRQHGEWFALSHESLCSIVEEHHGIVC